MSTLTIQQLFKRPITRHINGVVKAEQIDHDSIWQELDEFVITREINDRLRQFIDAYVSVMDSPENSNKTSSMGVWISGFFGSGKSHLLKVLAHLLRNELHTHENEERRAISFFESKIDDPMLMGDIKRVVMPSTDVILFNIDSKADKNNPEVILKVFLKVFNELQGYSPDHPHIAHMERYLEDNGKLDVFKKTFADASGTTWEKDRDAYEFHRDEVVEAFKAATRQSKESAEKWVDNSENNFSISIEKFAGWVKDYLDKKGPQHRLLFFVDEIGQFIGDNTDRMLSLQTLTEDLGVICKGRAWVVVTSQEDMDSVIGEVKTSKVNDFSKIQGRFKTKMSLSSANVDEVIQARLLDKTEEASKTLASIWKAKEDVLRHQVSLPHTAMTFKTYSTEQDFLKNYPFIPYQFKLLQKVFEAIRKVGASGQHLSQGERSILDAIQVACKQIKDCTLGQLVPLWRFYPAIEGFLDSAVSRTINNATDTDGLSEFDIHLLKGLFLIRYVEEIKGTVDNLVTLCLEEIDQDRIALKGQIVASLERLEKESLIKRTGDQFFFLTNEERDISKEIKQVELGSSDENKYFAELLFGEVLKDTKKHRYYENKIDFDMCRVADDIPYGSQSDNGLKLHVISALNDDHDGYDKARGLSDSGNDQGHVIVVMPANDRLAQDLRTCVQTDKYLRRNVDGSQAESVRRILRDVTEDNQTRKNQLVKILADEFVTSTWYVASQNFEPKGSNAESQMISAMDMLVDSTFTKRKLLEKVLDESSCKHEIQAVLRANDTGRQEILIKLEESNGQALEEVRGHIELLNHKHQQIVISQLLDKFNGRPYAWPVLDTALLLARLYVAGEITFIKDSEQLPQNKVYDALVTPALRKLVTIKKRVTANPAQIRKAWKIGKELFGENFSDEEIPLFEELRSKFRDWENSLKEYRTLAETGDYPGKDLIADLLSLLAPFVNGEDSAKFIDRLVEQQNDLLDAESDVSELKDFYDYQRQAWKNLCRELDGFEQNHYELEATPAASEALATLRQIVKSQSPYRQIKDAPALINKVKTENEKLIADARNHAKAAIDAQQKILLADLASCELSDQIKGECLKPLQSLAARVSNENVLSQLNAATDRAMAALEMGQNCLRKALEAQKPDPAKPDQPKLKQTVTIKVTDFTDSQLLETQEQVDAFLSKLHDQLNQQIAQGKRIQIR